jgi:hypothetical protein
LPARKKKPCSHQRASNHWIRQAFEQLLNVQLQQTEALTKALKAELSNATRQLEAFLNLQQLLQGGDSIAAMHGWPISPDIGLFLAERLREHHYDLIIEFGSGTSTVLFAQLVDLLSKRTTAYPDKPSDVGEPVQFVTEIVSFEHDHVYHAKTLQMLKSRGIDQHVHLVHAPLVDWCDGDQTYLYYDCQNKLTELAQRHANRKLRILLLVDGPPGATCPNARYPAVPFVFTTLWRHRIDLVLDDANRPEEKLVINMWRSYWTEKTVQITESLLQSEKGIFVAFSQ